MSLTQVGTGQFKMESTFLETILIPSEEIRRTRKSMKGKKNSYFSSLAYS